jgi:ABC-type spermidine/putrescine transport system permease subunit I
VRSKLDSHSSSLLFPLLASTVAASLTLFAIVAFSFADWSADTNRIVGWGSMKAYTQLARESFRGVEVNAEIRRALRLTVIEVVLALPFAWMLMRRCSTQMRTVVLGAITLPYFVNPLVRAFAWRLILQRNGLISELSDRWLHLSPAGRTFAFRPEAVDIAIFSGSFAFAVLPLMIALQRVQPSVWMASESLGAGAATEFRRVALRFMVVPAVFSAVCVFAISLGASAEAAYLGGANDFSLVTSIRDAFDQNPPEAFALGTVVGIRIVLIALSMLIICGTCFGLRSLWRNRRTWSKLLWFPRGAGLNDEK